MSDDLMSVEDMAEIPKDLSAAQGKSGCSKGVNLFLARQKLIADMMEQEDEDQPEGSHTQVASGTRGIRNALDVCVSHIAWALQNLSF